MYTSRPDTQRAFAKFGERATPDPPTFGQLCRLEHRLDYLRGAVERFASRAGRRRPCCGNVAWVRPGGYREALVSLVGPGRGRWFGTSDPDAERLLRSDAALAVTTRELRHRLPPCRGCTCSDPVSL